MSLWKTGKEKPSINIRHLGDARAISHRMLLIWNAGFPGLFATAAKRRHFEFSTGRGAKSGRKMKPAHNQ
ncbi:hypothetical protein A6R70_07610 [Agrobacterium rubi]|nr:hypothetical protein [Agrobacterium rubi]